LEKRKLQVFFGLGCLKFESAGGRFENAGTNFESLGANFENAGGSFESLGANFQNPCVSFENSFYNFDHHCINFENNFMNFRYPFWNFESYCGDFDFFDKVCYLGLVNSIALTCLYCVLVAPNTLFT
jgi:hypothetical protein